MNKEVKLIRNIKAADCDCAWCGARKDFDVHSPACPVGERYKQVQSLGGVKWNPKAAFHV